MSSPFQLLHGEQYLELLAPLAPEGTLKSEAAILDVLDKGSGAAVLLQGPPSPSRST